MSVSEELRKLQERWLEEDLEYIDALAPIIAFAEQQERELAALHEQIMDYQADPQYDARFIEGQDKTEAALKEQKKPTYCLGLETVKKVAREGQLETGEVDFVAADSLFHEEVFTSADLREVAEMAIHGCLNWPSRGTWPTADSIVREFREKKAEVKAQ